MTLSAGQVLQGYAQGVFPMAHEGQILWFDPDPRAVLPLGGFHVPRRLARTVRHAVYRITVDQAFDRVIRACARAATTTGPAPDDEGCWIDARIVAAYNHLHDLGFAHSVEAWRDGQLVGGLYGVALRGLFAGESMFSRARDASKVALVHLVAILHQGGYSLLDVQFQTDHLRQFGTVEISRDAYHRRLRVALQAHARFPDEPMDDPLGSLREETL